MKKHFLLFILASFCSFASLYAGNTVAVVTFVEGEVKKAGVLGFVGGSALSKGDVLEEGDTVVTGNGKADIQIGSGSVVRVNENSKLKIKGMQESGKTSLFDLILSKGKIHSKVGSSKDRNYSIKTPTATVGVRGTEFIVSEDGFDLDNGVYMKEGEAEVHMDILCLSTLIPILCKDPIVVKAGEQIVYDESGYQVSSVTSTARSQFQVIDTFKIIPPPKFHAIRQEYYDVGPYNAADYGAAKSFQKSSGRSSTSPRGRQQNCPYYYRRNNCCNHCY